MEGAIAYPHWKACETCKWFGENGCSMRGVLSMSYEPYAEEITCDDYEEKEED